MQQGPVQPLMNVDLLTNSSFGTNGMFSLQGWTKSVDSLVASSTDIPTGVATYSVQITPGVYPQEGAVYQTIPALAGTHIYQFSVWAKIQNAEGEVYINVLHYSPPTLPVRIIGPEVFSTVWQQYIAVDTISANSGDSIRIGLEADTNATGKFGLAYYNNCTFEEIN